MADVQIAIIDQQNTQIALAAPPETQVTAAVPGVQGPKGEGVPTGGTANQVLFKQSSTNYDTAWGAITSAMIGDLQIVDGDVSTTAAIAGTKISPNFGAQNVVTTGTSTAASFIPTSSSVPTNGVYLPAANSVAISTNGTGRLFVDASGNVGVGTSAPANGRLNVSSATNQITVDTTDTTTYGRLDIGHFANGAFIGTYAGSNTASDLLRFGTGGTERLRITSAGLVGIGTSSPSVALDVVGQIKTSLLFNVNGEGYIRGDAVGELRLQSGTSGTAFRNNANNATRLYITDAGLVGIGTTSPISNLHVVNPTTTAEISLSGGTTAASYSQLGFYGSTTRNAEIAANSAFLTLTHQNSGVVRVETGGTERARIDSSGRLLVGTSSSIGGESLQISNGTTADTLGLYNSTSSIAGAGTTINFRTDGGATGRLQASIAGLQEAAYASGGRLVFSTTADGASSPTERMRITNAGLHYFMANGNDTTRIQNTAAAGTVTSFLAAYHSSTAGTVNTGTLSLNITTNGNITNTNNSYGAISDIKLKENIVDANSQWDDLKALQVRNYNFKEGQTHTQIGLVAQEVEFVSPGLVSESPDRDEEGNDLGTVTKSVNYSVLYMKAVKALQEAMERIEQLEADVAALKAQ